MEQNDGDEKSVITGLNPLQQLARMAPYTSDLLSVILRMDGMDMYMHSEREI